MTMITPSYLGETIEYSSLHACRSTLEDPITSGVNRPKFGSGRPSGVRWAPGAQKEQTAVYGLPGGSGRDGIPSSRRTEAFLSASRTNTATESGIG